jgi:sugar phosphate permease
MTPADRPSRTRFILVFWLCGLAGVLYLDRVCMAQAAKPIREEFDLSNTQIGYVHIAFMLAYGLFEIPTGRLGDRVGARRVLTRIVLWWSFFTALTGGSFGLVSLLVVRFLFGAGEAGAFPNAARILSRWFPATERGRIQGIMLTFAQLGGVAAPYLAAFLIDRIEWRLTFVVFGLVGVVWAAGFWWWFRDEPAEHPRVNAAEVALIRAGAGEQRPHADPIPWRAVLRNSGMWLLGLTIACSAFNSYLYMSWFPTYLQDAHGLTNIESGRLSSLILAGGAIGVLSGGIVADRLLRGRLPVAWGRRLFGCSAYVVAAGLLAVAIRAESPVTLTLLVAVSYLAVQLTLPTWWSCAIEQSGRHVGALFGLLNMVGLIGGVASQWFVGYFADGRKAEGYTGRAQWDPMFDAYIVVLLVGAVLWALYRCRPLLEPGGLAALDSEYPPSSGRPTTEWTRSPVSRPGSSRDE